MHCFVYIVLESFSFGYFNSTKKNGTNENGIQFSRKLYSESVCFDLSTTQRRNKHEHGTQISWKLYSEPVRFDISTTQRRMKQTKEEYSFLGNLYFESVRLDLSTTQRKTKRTQTDYSFLENCTPNPFVWIFLQHKDLCVVERSAKAIPIETDRQTDRRTDNCDYPSDDHGQTDRQTDGQTSHTDNSDRCTDRQNKTDRWHGDKQNRQTYEPFVKHTHIQAEMQTPHN